MRQLVLDTVTKNGTINLEKLWLVLESVQESCTIDTQRSIYRDDFEKIIGASVRFNLGMNKETEGIKEISEMVCKLSAKISYAELEFQIACSGKRCKTYDLKSLMELRSKSIKEKFERKLKILA